MNLNTSSTENQTESNGAIALQVQNVHKSFGAKVVHRGITFTLKRGEILALLGGSGTGKSVILRSIIGLEKPDEGKIIFDGQDITQLTENQLIPVRTKIGYVFQNGALFDSQTVEENLAYPLREHTDMNSEQILTRVNEMLELIDMKGANDLLPAELSGGEQQRVAIARALMNKPGIIFADEPTGNLDSKSGESIMDLLFGIVREERTALVVVTHDRTLSLRGDRRLEIKDGMLDAEAMA